MGDRSNIVVQNGEDRVWLYGHWMGCASVEHAAHGLRSDRFDHPQYLAPIIFAHMTGDRSDTGTGFGISARRHGNQHPVLVIDSRPPWITGGDRGSADVWFEDEDASRLTRTYSRAEFLAIVDAIEPSMSGGSEAGRHDCAFTSFIPGDGDPARTSRQEATARSRPVRGRV